MRALIRNPRIAVPVAVAVVAALSWLAFGFFGVHLLFTDDRVDEAVPVFDAPTVTAAPATAPPTTASSALGTSTTSPAPSLVPTSAPAPVPVVEASGAFVSRDHPTSGTASVLGNGTGQRFLRFESFETDNGPDVNVYLVNSAAGGVSDIVDLGDLKGNIGDQNYEIPAGVDLATYDTVLLWCVRFSSPFGEATLAIA